MSLRCHVIVKDPKVIIFADANYCRLSEPTEMMTIRRYTILVVYFFWNLNGQCLATDILFSAHLFMLPFDPGFCFIVLDCVQYSCILKTTKTGIDLANAL